MDCYAAFASIADDFKEVIGGRERSLRRLQEDLAAGLADESNAVRRLEHQIEVLKVRLEDVQPATRCSHCLRSLVHDHYSSEVARHVRNGCGRQGRSESRRGSEEPNVADHGYATQNDEADDEPLLRSADFSQQWDSLDRVDFGQQWSPALTPKRGLSPSPWRPARRQSPTAGMRPPTPPRRRPQPAAFSSNDLEARMRHLNAKIDQVSMKTFRMLDRTSNLSDTSEALRDQIVGLRRHIAGINDFR